MNTRTLCVLAATAAPAVLAAGWLSAQSGPATAPAAPSQLTATSGAEPRPVVLYVQEGGVTSPAQPFAARGSYYGGYGQPQPVPDAVQLVSCVLQIDTDGTTDGSRPDAQSATALATSTALLDAAAEKALDMKSQQRRDLVVVSAYPAGYRFTKLEVALRPSKDVQYKPTAARDMMMAVCEGLKGAYQESATAQRKLAAGRREQAEKDLQAARTRAAELRQKVKAARDLLGGNEGMDPAYHVRNLRQQRQSMEQDLNRHRARLAAIDPGSGPLVAEWESVVKLREQRVNELKTAVEAKKSQANDLAEAEARLAEARAQLAAAKQSFPGNNDPSVRTARAGEIASIRGQIAEAETRLKPVVEQLAKLEDPANAAMVDGFQELQQEEQRARNAISEANNRLETIRQQTRFDPAVSVTILDGKPD
jgi:chromosome segregation ATPase